MTPPIPTPPAGGDVLPTLPSTSAAVPPCPDEGELERLRHEVTGLRAALASRATIDQARGILIARYRITPEQAFAVLVRWSQHRNIKLRVIAEALVAAGHDAPDAAGTDPALRQWLNEQLAGQPDQ